MSDTIIKMEIIKSEKYKRANIRFTGIPDEKIREELKKEGWFYSRNHNVWYPKNDAVENSQNFAHYIQQTYFNIQQEYVEIISENSEKEELIELINNNASLEEILNKMKDFYGEEKLLSSTEEVFDQLNKENETKKNKNVIDTTFLSSVDPNTLEIAIVNKNNGIEQANDERDSKEMNAELLRLDAEAEAMERANGLREMEAEPEQKQEEFNEISWVPLHNGRDTGYTYINGHNIERYFIWENENGENEYSVSIDGKDLCFIDDETNEEHKLFFTESELNKQIINDTLYYGNSLNTIHKNTSTELTPEDIELCKKVIPPAQFKFTMELTEGEEGEFFRNKMKEIADTYRRINTDSELTNEDGTHTVGFRYFLGDSEIFLSEIDSDGIGFGYNILNGDLQMSEWGSTSLEEIMKIPYIEMDYHVPEDITIERMLYQEHPEYFSEYAPKEEKKIKKDSVTKKDIRANFILYVDGVDVYIDYDWTQGSNFKSTKFVFEKNTVAVCHSSRETTINLKEKINYSNQIDRNYAYYINYFKQFDGKVNYENIINIHNHILKIKKL